MKKYSRIFNYIGTYKEKIALYFVFILLSAIFSILSLGMLMPFLELIFNAGGNAASSGLLKASGNPLINYIRETLMDTINSGDNGKLKALGFICLFMIIAIFFKNLFLYSANYILNPLKNRVVNTIRSDLYNKILHLPIGYFTEKRKGDLISRITNDLNEVEMSVVGALEGWIRDPLNILLNLTFLFILSPQLTLFLLILIPIIGFVIGRITRSLKKQSATAAIKYGESLSILDETLGGLRVIKAFTAEGLLRGKFMQINDELLMAKNKISYRKELASPTSEFLGIVVFATILWYGGSGILGGSIPLESSVFIGYLGLFYNIIAPSKSLSVSFSNIQKGEVILPKSGSLQTVAPSLLLQTGDILFTRTNGNPKLVGKTGVFRDDQNGPVTFASYLVRFRVSAPNSSTWLQRLLNSDAFWRFAQSFALVNLQTNLNSTKYCRLSIPIPLTDEQELLSNWMDEQFKPLDQKSLVLNREITLLREYRTRFIADMVTGKLDVREVARSLPADASEAAAELADRDLADEEFSEADDELADELTGEPA